MSFGDSVDILIYRLAGAWPTIALLSLATALFLLH